MSERIGGLPASINNALQRATEMYDDFTDLLGDQQANDAVRGAIGEELNNVLGLVGPADNAGLVDRLIRAAMPLYDNRPDSEAVSRMAELFASDDDVRRLARNRGYDPDLVRDLLRERLLPNRG